MSLCLGILSFKTSLKRFRSGSSLLLPKPKFKLPLNPQIFRQVHDNKRLSLVRMSIQAHRAYQDQVGVSVSQEQRPVSLSKRGGSVRGCSSCSSKSRTVRLERRAGVALIGLNLTEREDSLKQKLVGAGPYEYPSQPCKCYS